MSATSLPNWMYRIEYKRQKEHMNSACLMRNTCDTGRERDFHEWIDGHPEPVASHQIFCTRCIGNPDLPPSLDCLAPSKPQTSPHACLCPRWLRQDHAPVYLGTIAPSK